MSEQKEKDVRKPSIAVNETILKELSGLITSLELDSIYTINALKRACLYTYSLNQNVENALNWIQNIPDYDIDNMNKDIDIDQMIKIEEQISLKTNIIKMFKFIIQRKGEQFGELLYQYILENNVRFIYIFAQ